LEIEKKIKIKVINGYLMIEENRKEECG